MKWPGNPLRGCLEINPPRRIESNLCVAESNIAMTETKVSNLHCHILPQNKHNDELPLGKPLRYLQVKVSLRLTGDVPQVFMV